MTSFLILHGLGGSGEGHWQRWLYNELKKRNKSVFFPQFSGQDRPVKEIWLEQLNHVIGSIPETDPLVVVTHSLGCILWIHYAAQAARRRVKRAILVSPPSQYLSISEIRNFFPLPETKDSLATAADKTMFVMSANDPYLPQQAVSQYFEYGVPCVILPGMGHINVESGWGPWPWILESCLIDRMPIPDSFHGTTDNAPSSE
ncbi:alpha/beta fold hydrolase [Sporolactobacillus sp. THM7-4]|nr:alpha/beta fold hydrolase [Sporolactobacillus sp. THM7-4]